MQHAVSSLKIKTLVILTSCIWIGGLLAAGSDGPMMPYLNLAGALVFLGASVILARLVPKLSAVSEKDAVVQPLPRMAAVSSNTFRHRPVTPVPGNATSLKGIRRQGLRPGFARELGVV